MHPILLAFFFQGFGCPMDILDVTLTSLAAARPLHQIRELVKTHFLKAKLPWWLPSQSDTKETQKPTLSFDACPQDLCNLLLQGYSVLINLATTSAVTVERQIHF